MEKHRNKIIAAVVIALVLVFAYWYGGNSPSSKGFTPKTKTETTAVSNDELKEKEPKKEEAKESRNLKEESVETDTTSSLESQTKQNDEVFNENKIEKTVESEKNEKSETTEKELTCTMSIRCDTILENMDWLSDENHDVIPSDGVVYEERTVVFYEGESVFDLLLREMKKNKIHIKINENLFILFKITPSFLLFYHFILAIC